jgi:hypothetical protein
MSDHVYSDKQITITRDYIVTPLGERESVAIGEIQELRLHRVKVGDYTAGGIGFLLLGILSVWFMIGFLFIALGIAGLMTKIYTYRLVARVRGEEILLLQGKGKGQLKSLLQTIHGLITSKKLMIVLLLSYL